MAFNDAAASQRAVELVQSALASKAIDFGPMNARDVDSAKIVAQRDATYLATLLTDLKAALEKL